MKLFTIAKIEIKKSLKPVFTVSLMMGLFILMIASIFDPELFEGVEEMMEAYPAAILDMVGGIFDLATFGGFFNMEFLSMIWVWLGIYFILKAGQDIPSTIENKTIDLILSKPLKRWEFVLGRYLRFVFSIFSVLLFMGLTVLLLAVAHPNLKDQDLDFMEFFWALTWAFLFVLSLATTAFFFSTFLTRKKATGAAFGAMVVFFVIGTFYSYFDIDLQDIKFLSIFFYYDPGSILISHDVFKDFILEFLVLSGYSVVMLIASMIIFDRRDIPV
ncbi:MAG: ABC transporter permease subunit [Promethearchaeota archaeon]